MKNIGITKVMEWGIDDFVSDIGIKIRRLINPIFRRALKLGTKRKIIVEQYPKLKKDMPYIFAATHSFDDDIISTLSAIDRSAFLLTGCTDQIAFNPQMYAGWLNGMIYVDRLDPISRKESVVKMKKILEKGSSVLIFPEGGWNNTENLLIQPLFAGPYTLNRETGRLVVSIASFHEKGGDKIYIRAGNPMSFDGMSKDEGLTTLRHDGNDVVQNDGRLLYAAETRQPSGIRPSFGIYGGAAAGVSPCILVSGCVGRRTGILSRQEPSSS